MPGPSDRHPLEDTKKRVISTCHVHEQVRSGSSFGRLTVKQISLRSFLLEGFTSPKSRIIGMLRWDRVDISPAYCTLA